MRQSMEETKMLLKARQTCIWIHSVEEVEVIKDIKEIVRKELRNAKLFVWSNTEGVKHLPFAEGESAEPTDVKLREIPALFASIREKLTKDNTCSVYILRDLHNLTNDPRTRRCIRDIAEYPQNKYIPLIVISPTAEVHSEIAHLFKTVEYGLPSVTEISDIVENNNRAIAKKVNEEGRTDLAYLKTEEGKRSLVNACLGFTVKETKETLFQSLVKYKSFNLSYVTQRKIDAIRKSGLLDYKEPQISLSDVGGHRDLKTYLLGVKEQLTPAARDFGLPMPKGALFLGLAGCGKTMAAEAFAGTLKVPLLSLSMARVMSRFVGESENKIDQALSIVRSTGSCLLLLDEVEKMLGGYNSSNNTDSGITARVFQSILKFMQNNDTGAYVILTSNDVSQLPPEFTRTGRLDSQWFFSFPNSNDREEIAKIHLKRYQKTLSKALLSHLVEATANFTGAEIAEVINNVMRHVFLRTKGSKKFDVTQADITNSVSEVTPVFESNRERVNVLRTWVKGRARFTDGSYSSEEKGSAILDPLSNGLSF